MRLSDSSPNSLLPYYFGSMHAPTGLSTILPGRGEGRRSIQVLCGAGGETTDSDDAPGARSFDRVLLDAGRPPLTGEPEAALVIAIPDMGSVIRLASLAKLLDARPARACLVLNKFDAQNAMHVTILARLKERFGQTTPIVTIPFSPLFPEALAAGQTVVDWAPQSDVVRELAQVAAWTRGES